MLDARSLLVALMSAGIAATSIGCSGLAATSPTGLPRSGAVLEVVAAENFWGAIAAEIGGTHVQVKSIVVNPNADPHSYEPTPADARDLATSRMVVVNGLGYDPWISKLIAADPGRRTVLTVGSLLGLGAGANPHRWYNPGDVRTVIQAISADYGRLDPGDAAYFEAERNQFETVGLGPYDHLISRIEHSYGGTPIGASESIVSMLAPALGLDVVTPYSFLRAISEGSDISSEDKTRIDTQIRHHQIKIYVYNTQNTTPDVQAQIKECGDAGIPTAAITETLTPASATYPRWQAGELRGILSALRRAYGR